MMSIKIIGSRKLYTGRSCFTCFRCHASWKFKSLFKFTHNFQFRIWHRTLKYNTKNPDEYNTVKNTEACAIQLTSTYNKLCILTIYRSPMGNFTKFLNWLDFILQKLYKRKYIICGDVNVNYLKDNTRKSQLDAVLHSYNLAGIVILA